MISTLLTGLGRIGQLYDYNLPSDKFNLSHAQALTSDKRFNLLAGVDINSDHRQRFETKFGKPALCDLSELKGFPNPLPNSGRTPIYDLDEVERWLRSEPIDLKIAKHNEV